jgi:hypothetical protein
VSGIAPQRETIDKPEFHFNAVIPSRISDLNYSGAFGQPYLHAGNPFKLPARSLYDILLYDILSMTQTQGPQSSAVRGC